MKTEYLCDKEDRIGLILHTTSELGGRDPSDAYIDEVVSEEVLHRFDPEDVLDIAFRLGFMISASADNTYFRANGFWLKPKEPLSEELKCYGNIRYDNRDRICCAQNNVGEALDSKAKKPGVFPAFLDDMLKYAMAFRS